MSPAWRPWQAAFLSAHAGAAGADFLLVATPGAGKTLAACEAARVAACAQVIVVLPHDGAALAVGRRRRRRGPAPRPPLAQRRRRTSTASS